jgi:hypothetical protein
MLDVFESWDLTKPLTPPRSLLFALEPIGVGSPFVESLTSYICRLAEVHAVRVSDLAGHVLAKCVPRDAPIVSVRAEDYRMASGFRAGTHAINGRAEDARRWIAAVETATKLTGLRFLTLTPLQPIFSKQFLLRKGQAWCPNCFSEWRQSGLPLYLPLSWHLQMVTMCVKHRRRLEEICPHCNQRCGVLYANSRPGYCPRCRRWLGHPIPPQEEPSPEHGHGEHIWMADCIGGLLAFLPQLEEDHLRDILRDNILALTAKVAQGNPSVFCDLAGFPSNTIHRWSIGQYRLRPDQLFRICSRLRIPAAALLSRTNSWNIPDEIVAAGFTASRRGAWRDDPEKLKIALLDALAEDPPPSLTAVAARLNYKTCAPLRRLAPITCAQIARRYIAYYRPHSGTWVFRGRKCMPREIEKMLMESLAHDPPIPLSHIAAELGAVSTGRLRKHFPELSKAILRRWAEYGEERLTKAQAALMNAVSEEPPPPVTSLARRLGCTNAYLTLNFPDLCRQLRNARDAWRVQERQVLQRRIENTAQEMRGVPVPEVCRAVGIKQMFLYNNFPALHKQIASAYLARRDALREQRRAVLREEVRRAVVELSQKGIRPNTNNVAPFLSDRAAKDWNRIRQEIHQAIAELDHPTLEP